MIPILTAAQMRACDAKAMQHCRSFVLMQRAGQAAFDALQALEGFHKPCLLAGPGHNGGDVWVLAGLLHAAGQDFSLLCLQEPHCLPKTAKAHADLAIQQGVRYRLWDGYLPSHGCFVDGLFGIGLNRDVEGAARNLIEAVNRQASKVLALDIASGLHADTGLPCAAAIRASYTLPIAADQWGYYLSAGPEYSGLVLPAAEIGIDVAHAPKDTSIALPSVKRLQYQDLLNAFVRPARTAHKGDLGRLCVYGGSRAYLGAPVLACLGAEALRTGMISIVCDEDVYLPIASLSANFMVYTVESMPAVRASAFLLGSGWGLCKQKRFKQLLAEQKAMVVDADALHLLARHKELQILLKQRQAITVLTPHPGEAARLLACSIAKVQADRPWAAAALQEKFSCPVVLKGAETLIVLDSEQALLCPFGSVHLAVAGSGDVLAGMIAGLLSQGLPVEKALLLAVAVHALAGESSAWRGASGLAQQVAKQWDLLSSP